MTEHALSPPPVFSDAGAQDNAVVVREAQEWIEEVTGCTFGSSFRESLEDGVLLCQLMRKINPGSISRINKLKSPIAHLDNIQQFLTACQELGMRDAQLFDTMDLQAPKVTKKTGVKRDEADRRIRSVCVTLYWLGRTVADMDGYSGPQLDLNAFRAIMEGTGAQYSDDEDSNCSPIGEHPDHYQLEVEVGNHVASPEPVQPLASRDSGLENGIGLTFEQEQTADQLLADIQSAVDEMLQDFQTGHVLEENTNREKTQNVQPPQTLPPVEKNSNKRVGVSVHMISRNGGFGFQIIGGADANYHPEVELVLPGSAAEDAGIRAGDELVSVNKQDVSNLSHHELILLIKKAGSEGSVLMGLVRTKGGSAYKALTTEAETLPLDKVTEEPNHVEDAPPTNHQPHTDDEQLWTKEQEERDRQARELASMYSSTAEKETPPIVRLPPTTSYGGQPLPTLVEYQEEAILEQITEMIEKSPPPKSPTPTPPPSPLTKSPLLTNAQLPDDRESIERDLQEIVLMEMTAATEQQQKQNELELELSEPTESTDGHVSPPSPEPVIDPQQSMEEQIQELLNFGNPSSPSKKSPNNDEFDLNFDLPPPLFESPPPPKPTTEAPKRQVQKASPPAPKPKPKRRPASFVEATALTSTTANRAEIERSKSTTPTGQKPRFTPPPPPTSPPPKSPSPPLMNTPSPLTSTPSTAPPSTTAPSTTALPTAAASPPPSIPMTPPSQPPVAKEVGPITPDDVEIVGNIKIHRVQRTRWTPKGSSTQIVASPVLSAEEQYRQRSQQHFTQMWTDAATPTKQNGLANSPEPTLQSKIPPTPKTAPPFVNSQPVQKRNSPKQRNDRRYTQPASMAGWQMPLQRDNNNVSASNKVLSQSQQSNVTKTHWKSQEELRSKRIQQVPSPGQSTQPRKVPIRQQSIPARVPQYKTQSLPRGIDQWRRSNTTGSRSDALRPRDGQQSAFAVQPKSPYDLCSRCHKSLGAGTVMSIPNLKVQYHIQCFTCRVCRAPLVKGPHNTSVLIKGMHPHCRYCGSNDQGVLTTEC